MFIGGFLDLVRSPTACERTSAMPNRSHPHHLTSANKLLRLFWRIVWVLFFRSSPRLLHCWRRFLLRLFGATVGNGTVVYPSVQIWAPWNLSIGNNSCLSHFVDCYCVDKVFIGNNATISQYSFLCTASHDYNGRDMPLTTGPIIIENFAWITADVFIGPGVIIGEGAVVGARSTVTKDIAAWTIVAGTPPKTIAQRNRAEFL